MSHIQQKNSALAQPVAIVIDYKQTNNLISTFGFRNSDTPNNPEGFGDKLISEGQQSRTLQFTLPGSGATRRQQTITSLVYVRYLCRLLLTQLHIISSVFMTNRAATA